MQSVNIAGIFLILTKRFYIENAFLNLREITIVASVADHALIFVHLTAVLVI